MFILDNFEIWIECDGVGDQWNCAFSLSDEWQLLKPEIHPNSVASEFCRRRKFQFFIFRFQLFPMEISLIFSLKVKKANKIWSHVFGCVFEYSAVFYANCGVVGVVPFLAGWAPVPVSELIPFYSVSVSPVSVAHITKCLYIGTCVTVPFPVLSHFRKSDKIRRNRGI